MLRDFQRTTRPSLSERCTVVIDGVTYEEDLTSGGAADLPAALEGKVRHLDYKTLRYPGHYAWIEQRVALEVEGGVWTRGRHTRGSGYVKDLEKYSEAAAQGWRLVRVTPDQLCTLETIELLKRALAYDPSQSAA